MKGSYAKEKTKTNSILKKIILIAIIVTMLAGDFILPIKLWSIAKEIEKIENSISTNKNESSSDNLNEATNNGEKDGAENSNLAEENTANGEYTSEEENSAKDKDNLENSTDASENSKGAKNENAEENADEGNSADENVGENASEDAASKETTNEETNAKEGANSAKSSLEDSKNVNENQGTDESSNGENLTEENANEESNNEEQKGEEQNNENSLNNQEPSLMKRVAPVGLLNTNNSLSLPQTLNANAEQPEKTLEELDSEIKATSKDTINERKQNDTYKSKNNLYEIRRFNTQFLSGAKKDENGNLVWSATTNNSGHEFTFRVNYALSGYGEIPAGDFRITIPKKILRNRDGNLDDYYIMSLPTLAECRAEDHIAELIYKEDGDYLVIYNPNPVDAGLNGYFEISYATNSAAYNYKDYNPENLDPVKLGGTASDEFYAILELNVDKDTENSENNGNSESNQNNTSENENSGKELLNNITTDKNVFIDTTVELKSTQKRIPTIYRTWDSSWMQTVPQDKDEYYYLVWEICSYIGDDITQKYNFTLQDTVTDLTGGTSAGDYELVGYKMSGETYFSNKNTVSNQSARGYRYDYVLTRHKISAYSGKSYSLKNSVKAIVHPMDGVDSDTQEMSSNTFKWDPVSLQSTQKNYPTIYKEWNSSWQETVPEDKDDYYYLIWEIRSYVKGNSIQKYNFSIQDFVTNSEYAVNPGDYEVVGYKMAGEKYYTNKNTALEQSINGYRSDFVLTRHKKSVFMGRSYNLGNSVTVSLYPSDGVGEGTILTSGRTFYWDGTFKQPSGSFNVSKYGNNNWHSKFGRYWNYTSYDLNKLQDGEVDKIKGFKYYTETEGYAYPWTLKVGGDKDYYADYGINNVNYDTWDDSLYLEDDENPMNTNDYYLDYLTYSVSNYDAVYDDFYNKFNQTSVNYTDDDIITFYAKFGDRQQEAGNTWVQIGTYNLKTKEINITNENVQSMTTDRITFKEGAHATGWRFTTSNKHYYTKIAVTPYFVLTNSEYVMGKIQNKSSIKIENGVNTKITDNNGTTIYEKVQNAFDYARVTYFNSDIYKTVSSVANKKVKKQYTITWKVNVWETATFGEGVTEYVKQDSGTFYDIVPLGGDINVNTIQVQTEKGFLEENEYSYEVIANYKNSGRTMLVVKINEQADWYNIYYTTIHSWESMKDYGRQVLNPVAFETGNAKITKGLPDDGGNLSSDNKQLFNDLDNTTNDKKFLYAERTYNINALTAAMSGLQHKAKSTKDEDYKYDIEVEPEESYTYRLRFENTYMNSAKNLVFFDSIENFKVADEENQTEKTSGWHGTLKGIDLTQAKQKGIDAKVYVSTINNLDLEENHDLGNTSVWTLLTDETDLKLVKAIAIDMTKKTNGEDFVLNAGDSVSANLYMQSPENSSPEIEQNQYAYGNVYMQNTLIDELGETVDYFIHQDYTTVKYKVVADIPMQKINAQNEEEGIKDITFRLYGTSRFGNEVDEYITTGNNGLATFKSIEAGEYILQEYSGNRDWVEDHTEHFVTINMDRTVLVDNIQITKENVLKIANTPRAHTDVIVYKKDLVNKNKALEGAKFKLSGTSDYGNEILVYGVSDSFGKVFFEDIEKGKYKLEEISTAHGYTLNEYNKEVFRVIVDENSNYNVEKLIDATNESYETTYINGRYEIYNEPLHGFYFMKKDLIDINKGVAGVSFKITGTSDYGNYFEQTATSDETGKVTFEGIEKGTYYLWETETKSEYVLNTDTYTVQIDKMGDFTITENHLAGETDKHIAKIDGKYNIYNEPKHSFYFIKKDSYNNEKLGGAKFKLYGSSNIGNVYDEEVESSADTGAVEFTNLESGTYFLKEIKSPNTDETSFVPDEKERIVEITEDGKVKLDNELIWPLEERAEGEPYAWLNTRNKGQITITKKWVDNLTNEERQEPKIYISTLNNEEAYSKVYFREGDNTHSIIDYVTSQNVTAFKRNITLTEAQVTAKANVVRIDNNADTNAKYKIYAWEDHGTVFWWTKADRAVLPSNLDYYFQNEAGLTDISWTGIYRNGYWQGTVGNEEISTSITNMQNMFYGCEAMENLDISWFNNSGITEKANMQYVFGNNGDSPEGAMSTLKYITFGNNFKLFDTSILPKGNWKKQGTEEQKKNTELTGTLDAGTYEWSEIVVESSIGKKVNFSTTLNGVELNDWSVFYVDGDYTYIILDDYLPNTAVPAFDGKRTYSAYGVYASSNRKQLIDGLSTKTLWQDLINNGKINGTNLSQDVKSDANVWAMGSPTLEMFVDSWNTMYPEDKLYTAKRTGMSDSIGWGFYIGLTENPTSTYIYESGKQGYNNPLYFPHKSAYSNCNGFWLASPSAFNTYSVMYVYYSGSVNIYNYNYYFYSARPLVCLPSNILE